MNYAANLGPIDLFGHLRILNGSDLAKRAHKVPDFVIQRSGCFFKYLKIQEESTTDFWTVSHFGDFKDDERFGS